MGLLKLSFLRLVRGAVARINENEEVVWATWVERIFLAIYTVAAWPQTGGLGNVEGLGGPNGF